MDDPKGEALVHCTSCGKRQAGLPDLCEFCGAPLTAHAGTDPMLGIMARGFAAYQATRNPISFARLRRTFEPRVNRLSVMLKDCLLMKRTTQANAWRAGNQCLKAAPVAPLAVGRSQKSNDYANTR
jgi:hypothetical protein